MNIRYVVIMALAGGLALSIPGCRQKSPPRDQIPVLRQRLSRVEQALRDRNAVQIDSLLSSQVRQAGQPIDSLARFIYGADMRFPFYRFSNYEIVYNHDKARIDCDVSDSAGQQTRPVTLTFVLEGDRWQLKRWEPRADSIQTVE